jgi:hypothetical protein
MCKAIFDVKRVLLGLHCENGEHESSLPVTHLTSITGLSVLPSVTPTQQVHQKFE